MPGDSGLRADDDQRATTALLLIDVINNFEFEGGTGLARQLRAAVPRIVGLRDRLRRIGVPVIYCNDNFGQWRSDFRDVIRRSARGGALDRELVAALEPRQGDYFMLKPKHSAFHATALDLLLQHLGVRRLVLAGTATDSCIVCTATDAHMREYAVCIPRDCVAAITPDRSRRALALLRTAFDADVRSAARVTARYVASPPPHGPRHAGASRHSNGR
jgi:nicotinamidase-related amidase